MTDSSHPTHLVPAGALNDPGSRQLSMAAGMARVGVETVHLAAGDRVTIAGSAAAEGFVYVLDGQGLVSCAGEHQVIAAGDCLGLAPGDALTVDNPQSGRLVLLVAFSEGGTGVVRRQP